MDQPNDDALMGLPEQEQHEIGTEATIRFLKAKVHVLQKELEVKITDKKTKVNILI